jgi:hypothetical protein
MPTHAHAQGYADSNFLIPELVSGVQFRKGPYYAEDGDFSSAGSANINYFNVLERPIITVTGGSFDYRRFLGAVSPRVAGGNLHTAFEYEKDNGPWVSPNGKDKYNGLVRFTRGDARNGLSVTLLGFANHWHSTDQIPQHAVDADAIDRFGFIEESDGGETYRYSGVFDWQRSGIDNSTRVTGYVQRYGVQLFHNFTYFLNDPINGDQFEQFERRWTSGAKATHRRLMHVGDKHAENLFGVDFRNDAVGGPLGLFATRETVGSSTVRADETVRRVGDRMEPRGPDHFRPARQHLSLEGPIRQSAQFGDGNRRDRHTQGFCGVRTVARNRAVRELGAWLPLQLGSGSGADGRPRDGRGRDALSRVRARKWVRGRGAHRGAARSADHRDAVAPGIRF